jgi:hypothetical protein
VEEESEIEVGLLKQLDGRVLITCLRASRAFSEFVPTARVKNVDPYEIVDQAASDLF